jgi:hypothetical protein
MGREICNLHIKSLNHPIFMAFAFFVLNRRLYENFME